ncbi:hypothetical protein [Saccharothrix yanglingensis]|uniref:hypothetical protein n=1 Tax=Saccharothrix yanglingensis TaxID=659496 RepID=UPI00352944E6
MEPDLLAALMAEPWVRAAHTLDVDPAGPDVDRTGLLVLSRLPVVESGRFALGAHKAVAAVVVETATGRRARGARRVAGGARRRPADVRPGGQPAGGGVLADRAGVPARPGVPARRAAVRGGAAGGRPARGRPVRLRPLRGAGPGGADPGAHRRARWCGCRAGGRTWTGCAAGTTRGPTGGRRT